MLQKIGIGGGAVMSLLSLTACNLSTSSQPPASSSPVASAAPSALPVVDTPTPSAIPSVDLYQEALNAAGAARSISESAISKEDWVLVANQWQESVKFLRAVPKGNINYPLAAKILPQYQQNLSYARQKSANFKVAIQPTPAQGLMPVDNPDSFSIPILKKLDGIPVIEVTFNGQHRFQMLLDTGASRTLITRAMANQMQLQSQGKTQAKTANGTSEFDIVTLGSVQFGQGTTNNISVSVGKDELNYGLLGHDVYNGYDITLKENIILFKRR